MDSFRRENEGDWKHELTTVAEILRKTGWDPRYVDIAKRLLPRLFPEIRLEVEVGMAVVSDPRRQRFLAVPVIWNVTLDGVAVDIGARAIARRLGLRSRLPLLVISTPDARHTCPFITYAPDGDDVRAGLRLEDLENLDRLRALKAPVDLETPEAKAILIALRDEAVCVGHRMIRVSVPATLRDRAARLRPHSAEFRRKQRRGLANLIGRPVRVSGLVGEIRGRRRCLVDVVNARDGAHLADHLWVQCDSGKSGERLTLSGEVYRYDSPRGADFALRRICQVQVAPTVSAAMAPTTGPCRRR